jgi:iron complex transport system ATP-binding protein
MLEVKGINYSIGSQPILKDVSACFQPDKLSIILGPNGSGKSTLLRIISQEIDNYSGGVFYNGNLLTKKEKPAIAKIRAVLSQQSELSFPLPVEEVIMMGRYPHFDFKPGSKDFDICKQALKKMNMETFAERNYLTLSGGEKRRVDFARVLAQIWEQPVNKHRYLLLDEPIASLDLNYQHEFLRITKEIALQNTVTVAVIHDINLALRYADQIILLQNGHILAVGTPEQVITAENIFSLYVVKSKIVKDPHSQQPYFIVD